MKKYKILLLDADMTLLDFESDAQFALKKTMEEMGITEYTDDKYSIYKEINDACWRKVEKGEMTMHELDDLRFGDFFQQIGAEADSKLAAKKYIENMGNCGGRVLEETIPVLTKLKSLGVPMYVLSNGHGFIHYMRMERSGVMNYVEKDFVSEAVGAKKPDLAFFERVFAEIPEFSKNEAIMVGDSLTADMQGGINAGIDTCWYNPNYTENTLNLPVTMEIHSLHEILNFI